MRKPLLLLLFFVTFAGREAVRADIGDEEEQLATLELRCAKAMVSANVQWLSDFYAADWFLIAPDGHRFTREETLTQLSKGEVKWHSCKITEMEVHIFGDTAVVVYKADAVGVVHGEEMRDIEICSDTFARGDEGWRCVHSHNSNVQ